MRITRNRIIWAAALLVVAGLAFWWWYEPTYTIRVSRETTYLTGPLRPDGTVDYVAAMDAQLSKGVTRENNAAIPLLQALGPEALEPKTRQKTLDRLGLALPPIGNYYVNWSDFVAANPTSTTKISSGLDPEEPSEACMRLWTAGECPRLVKYLALNKAPLELAAQAAQRDRFYMPLVTAGDSDRIHAWILPPLQLHLGLARTLGARASGRFAQGDFDGGWRDLMTCHRLARLVSRHGSLIAELVGYSIDGVACGAEKTWLSSGKLTAVQARRMAADMQGLPPMPPVGPVISGSDRLFMLDIVSQLAAEGLGQLEIIEGGGYNKTPPPASPEKHVDWNKAMVRINAYYDKMEQICRQPTYASRVQAFDALENELAGFKANAGGNGGWLDQLRSKVPSLAVGKRRADLKKNPGESLLAMLGPSLSKARAMEDRNRTVLELNIVALALAAHKAEKGNYPASLSALTPAYLKAIPLDRFTGKPLIYKPSAGGFTLYSAGLNMKDDGGIERGGNGEDDLVVQVGPAAKVGK